MNAKAKVCVVVASAVIAIFLGGMIFSANASLKAENKGPKVRNGEEAICEDLNKRPCCGTECPVPRIFELEDRMIAD